MGGMGKWALQNVESWGTSKFSALFSEVLGWGHVPLYCWRRSQHRSNACTHQRFDWFIGGGGIANVPDTPTLSNRRTNSMYPAP